MDSSIVGSFRKFGLACLIAMFAGADGALAQDAANPCNPCAAANPCAPNPCAANPCAANPCAPNPCAAGSTGSQCVIQRLTEVNPCNPCAANPCAPNPCAAANPCAANPCNPCAANPCAPNPCAAANPCAANPCAAAQPCQPCAAAAPVELTDEEATAAYQCIKGALKAGYSKSGLTSATGLAIAEGYQDWQRYSTRPYRSETHGGRYVQNYANTVAKSYRKFEEAGTMPVGAIIAKDSFVVTGGRVAAGPLFVMEKMPVGFNADSGDWRYTMAMPDGKVIGTTNGAGSTNVEFCAECHTGVTGEKTDSLFFLPEEYRVNF
ncbi:MAG: cytochrome P460 family protein [Alphaproteobacteria bacterium]